MCLHIYSEITADRGGHGWNRTVALGRRLLVRIKGHR